MQRPDALLKLITTPTKGGGRSRLGRLLNPPLTIIINAEILASFKLPINRRISETVQDMITVSIDSSNDH